MNKEYKIKLDLNKKLYNKKMAFNQFDENVNDFYIEVTKNNELVKDLDKSIVTLVAIKPNNTVDAQFIEVKEGQIYADLKPSMCDLVGNYQAKAMIVLEGEIVTTDTINYSVNEDKIISRLNDDVASDERFTLFTDALARLSTIETSEEQRMINEAERILSEENRRIEEAKRVEAELVRQHEEADRAKYDATRESNENIRKQNESIRLANETNRIDEEAKRVDEENKRKLAEEERNANYNFMTEDEERRRSEANAHKEAEVLRVQAETNRVNEEAKRRTVEATRIVNEKNRQRIFEEKVLEVKNAINSIPSKSELKGEKGDKGDRGEQGIQGEQGLQGEKGDKGDKGEQGIQGLKGDKGDKGDVGPQGPQGLQGPQGEQGLKGDNGLTPNITIGNVTTLEPNQQATVTKRGTDANPIFDFGIPKGENGAGGENTSSGNSQVIFDYTFKEDRVIQPTSLDLATGIFTCDNVSFTGNCNIKLNTFSMNGVPKELGIHNNLTQIVKLSNTTFTVRLGNVDLTSYASDSEIDVSTFCFTPSSGNVVIENFGELENGVYTLRGFGTRGRDGHTIIDLLDKSGVSVIKEGTFSDGKPIMFLSFKAEIHIQDNYKSLHNTTWTVNNNTSGTNKGFTYSVNTSTRVFNYTDKKITKASFSRSFNDGFRFILTKEV